MASPLRSSREQSSSSLPPPPCSPLSDPLHHHHHHHHRHNNNPPRYPPPPRTRQQRAVIRKGPLWISAGILVLVPLFILNVQLWLYYQDPALQADQLVESQHWRPPSRLLGETDSAKCIQWESTGQLVWVQRDTVQILVVDAQQQWWFVPDAATTTASQKQNHNQTTPFTTTKLQLVQGPIQWAPPAAAAAAAAPPPQGQQQPLDLYQFRTAGGDDASPWHAAQRVVQEQWGIPSRLLRMTDYEGYREGKVPPLAQDHWKLLGRMPLMDHHHHHHNNNNPVHAAAAAAAGEFTGYLYTYLWKVQSGLPATTNDGDDQNNNAIALSSLAGLQRAIAQQRFVGMRSLASLALVMASTTMTTIVGQGNGDD
jgi:hypothetical protein